MKSKKLRTITALAVILVITVGFFTTSGIGTLSAPGISDISVLCPLGALTTMIASKMLVPRALVSLVVMIVLIVVFARAFCGWVCPVPLVQKLRYAFSKGTPKTDGATAKPLTEEEKSGLKACAGNDCSTSSCSTCAKKRGEALDARHWVLGGAILSTAIFGFPVFCLICPIGLTFGLIALLINLFAHGDVTWSLILVPVILFVELLLFRKWCHRLCPLSAFMSLFAKANRTFKPTIDDSKCLETAKGATCGACGRACNEGIDPRHPELSTAAWSECTKCRDCVDSCPTKAISMPLLAKKSSAGKATAADFK